MQLRQSLGPAPVGKFGEEVGRKDPLVSFAAGADQRIIGDDLSRAMNNWPI